MFRSTELLVISKAFAEAILNAIVTAAPANDLLDGALLKLYKTDVQPTMQSVAGDFTECDFTGYAEVTPLTWSAPGNNGSDAMLVHTEGNFIAGALSPGQTAYGYFITDAAGTGLLAAERFANPVAFAVEDDFLSLDAIINLYAVLSVAN